MLVFLLCGAAAAQQPGCGYGAALQGLAEAERALAFSGGLLEGRRAAEAARLPEVVAGLAACGCARLAALAGEAAESAALAAQADTAARLRAMLERARFAVAETRGQAGRQGCR